MFLKTYKFEFDDIIKTFINQKGKNNAPFGPCLSKINGTFIDNAEDFDIVIPMYNFLEYSGN